MRPLPAETEGDFDSIDRLEMSAGNQYFGIDDLTYFVSPN